MEFIEFDFFTKRVRDLLSAEQYRKIQVQLILNPRAGKVIPGTKGLRKLRCKAKQSGKRGGIRIIYYFLTVQEEVLMIYIYQKSEQEDLSRKQLQILINQVKGEQL